MFIYVTYKDAPELSPRVSSIVLVDTSVEKSLLVNPDCPVRIMLEYIRKKCRLGSFTQFDLCDDTGYLKGLFALNTYAYATDQFEHKKNYYIVVLRMEADSKQCIVLPQLNQENRMYLELQHKVKNHLGLGEISSVGKSTTTLVPTAIKTSPTSTAPVKGKAKKK